MTVVLMEGFDHSAKESKGWSVDGDTTAAGRINGRCLSIPGQAADSHNTRGFFPVPLTEFTIGFAFKSNGAVGAGYGRILNLKVPGAGKYDGPAGSVNISAAGSVGISPSGGPFVEGASVVSTDAWVYIEVHVKVAGAAGSFTVRVNGGPYIAATVANFGSSALQMVEPWNDTHNSSLFFRYDDIYVTDMVGVQNGFLGDCHVETLMPNGVGAHSDFTPLSGANWTNVEEKPPDDDTSYVVSLTPGHIDTYQMDDATVLGGAVLAVKTNLYSKKDDAGFRQLAAVYRQGGSDYVFTPLTLSASYVCQSEIKELNPATGVRWTLAEINANEFGAKLIA